MQSDIRKSLHQLIDEIDNEKLLMKFYELLLSSKEQKGGELWNQLSNKQRDELLIAESDSLYKINLIDHKKQKAKLRKWL